MDNDWIKDYRKSTEWGWYKDVPTCHLFFHLLRKANWKKGVFMNINVLPGELVTSLENLSLQTGLSVQQVRTAIKKLKSTNEITSTSTNSFTHIKVQNWGMYQQDITSTSTNEQQTNNKPITTIEEGNKGIRKETTTGDFDLFWSSYPKKVAKADTIRAYSKVYKEHENIMKGLKKFCTFHKNRGTEKQFIMGPAVFLNGRRWEDEFDGVQEARPTYDPLKIG